MWSQYFFDQLGGFIPLALMACESIAHLDFSFMGYWLRAHSSLRNNNYLLIILTLKKGLWFLNLYNILLHILFVGLVLWSQDVNLVGKTCVHTTIIPESKAVSCSSCNYCCWYFDQEIKEIKSTKAVGICCNPFTQRSLLIVCVQEWLVCEHNMLMQFVNIMYYLNVKFLLP